MKSQNEAKRRTGRPLSFDRSEALKQAMLAFWRHGYETTSIVDLTTAMKITAPSLYAAFGDKRQLFLEAVALYAGDPEEQRRAIENAASSFDAASDLLEAVAVAFTGDETPPGCLLASATATGSPEANDVRCVVASIRGGLAARFVSRIERDVVEGLLPGDTDPNALANLVVAVTLGMSVLARDGASRSILLALGKAALNGWPNARGRVAIDSGGPIRTAS